MTLLITGASGFIGSRLITAACAELGNEKVTAFSSSPALDCQSVVYQGADFNLSKADNTLLRAVDTLIHLGAFTPKGGAQADAIEECNSNISFTENLLKLPMPRLKKIVYISTIDVYEPSELTTENTPTLPISLYGWSKLYCEQMTTVFSTHQNIDCQILRIGHVYGPGEEKYLKFLPKAIKNILADEPVEMWGDGSEVRSFIYIDDVIEAIMKALSLDENVGPINIVGQSSISIRELLDKLKTLSPRPVAITPREFNGVKRNYTFNTDKLREHLLPQQTDLDSGLQAEYSYMAGLS